METLFFPFTFEYAVLWVVVSEFYVKANWELLEWSFIQGECGIKKSRNFPFKDSELSTDSEPRFFLLFLLAGSLVLRSCFILLQAESGWILLLWKTGVVSCRMQSIHVYCHNV